MTRQQDILNARIKSVLEGQSGTGGVPQERGLIRTVMLFCRHYQGHHPMILTVQIRMSNNPGWRPTYAYARTIKDVIDKIGKYVTSTTEHDTGPTSLD